MAWYDRARDWIEPRLLRLFSLLVRQPTGVATIVEQDDSILAVKFGDRYELPGGLVGRNETPEKAAQR
ncbi:MAG: hypothetical protein SVU32_01190, partial [Candidatus Nanohaloarchaea archaeon]|nr:hypothetical protein [Candidatus Nanohaloarchaea archaeon]